MISGSMLITVDIDGVDTDLSIGYYLTKYGEENDGGGLLWWLRDGHVDKGVLPIDAIGKIEDKINDTLSQGI